MLTGASSGGFRSFKRRRALPLLTNLFIVFLGTEEKYEHCIIFMTSIVLKTFGR